MQFKDIIGQQDIKERLITGVRKGRISHSQIFTGPPGNGKYALALAYAQYISCLNKTNEDSCGKCTACTKYSKLVHPDLHFVYPVVTSTKNSDPVSDDYLKEWRDFLLTNPYCVYNDWLNKISNENKQGGILKGESREILRKLNLKTFESEYKLMIIWLPEKMNPTSANKLLKIIEEPPPKTIFLMVSDEPNDILGTILSRSQLFKIPKIQEDDLKSYLISKHNLAASDAHIIARLANGNYNAALNEMQESEDNKINFDYFVQLMRLCYSYKVIEAHDLIEKITQQGREQQKIFLKFCMRLIRENFILNAFNQVNSDANYLNKKETEFSVKFSPYINNSNTSQINELFEKSYYYIERNGYDKLVFFDLSLNLMKLLRIK